MRPLVVLLLHQNMQHLEARFTLQLHFWIRSQLLQLHFWILEVILMEVILMLELHFWILEILILINIRTIRINIRTVRISPEMIISVTQMSTNFILVSSKSQQRRLNQVVDIVLQEMIMHMLQIKLKEMQIKQGMQIKLKVDILRVDILRHFNLIHPNLITQLEIKRSR